MNTYTYKYKLSLYKIMKYSFTGSIFKKKKKFKQALSRKKGDNFFLFMQNKLFNNLGYPVGDFKHAR